MKTVNRDDCFVTNNIDELLTALDNKEFYIIITEKFKQEFEEVSQIPLSENEKMGVNLGSRGMIAIFSEVFYQIGKLFSKDSNEQKKIESKLRSYTLKYATNNELVLYLSQLDY